MKGMVILGAGITGLTAGIKTGFPIYEASSVAGGLCRSYDKMGYRFERGGGHWLFGEAPDFLKSYGQFDKYSRDAGVYYNQMFDAPIQKHFKDIYSILDGTLQEWFVDQFGFSVCRLFFFPFNNKYTCGLYEDVIQDDAGKSSTGGPGYNDEFCYPKLGLENLVERLASENVIEYNKRSTSIDMNKKEITFADGSSVKYDKLISTIPLKDLLKLVGIPAPDLVATSISVTNIGAMRGVNCPKKQWVYIPDENVPFFRVGFYSNVSKDFSKVKNGVSIYVEEAFRGDAPEPRAVKILQNWRWIEEPEVVDQKIIETGYTWLYKNHKREAYLKMLSDNDITSTGRYGKWKFQGMLDCIKDGLNV